MNSALSKVPSVHSNKPRLFESMTLDQCIEESRKEYTKKKAPVAKAKPRPKPSAVRQDKRSGEDVGSSGNVKSQVPRALKDQSENSGPVKRQTTNRPSQGVPSDLPPTAGIAKSRKNKRKARSSVDATKAASTVAPVQTSDPNRPGAKRDPATLSHGDNGLPETSAANVTSKPRLSTTAHRISVSNLNQEVSEEDVTELFSAVGPLVSARLFRDADGRSACRADVVFVEMSDALEAIKRYNGVPLDNMPLKITLASERSRVLDEQAVNDAKTLRGRQGAQTRIAKRQPRNAAPKRDVGRAAHGKRSPF